MTDETPAHRATAAQPVPCHRFVMKDGEAVPVDEAPEVTPVPAARAVRPVGTVAKED
jgi:hypothetical protein